MSELIILGYDSHETAQQGFATVERLAAAMSEFGGTVLQTSLSDDDEKGLADELATQG